MVKKAIKNILVGITYLRAYSSNLFQSGGKRENIRNILIVMTSGIGNMILFVPTLRLLRKNYPNAHICLLVEPRGTKEIMETCPYVDEIVEMKFENRRDKKLFIKTLQKRNFDLTMVSFTSQNINNAIFTYSLGSPVRIGYDSQRCGIFYTIRVPEREDEHEVERNLDILRAMGWAIPNKEKYLELWLNDADEEAAKHFLKENNINQDDPIIGMHPGCHPTTAYRRWPVEKFAGLADILIDLFQAKIILFGGVDEVNLAQEIAVKMKNLSYSAVGKISLRETAALIRRCRLFITNDSGLMHIAAAVKTPLISIWGPSNHAKSAPYGAKERCLIVSKNLPCQPCYQMYQPFTCTTLDCLKLITVQDIVSLVPQFLGRQQ